MIPKNSTMLNRNPNIASAIPDNIVEIVQTIKKAITPLSVDFTYKYAINKPAINAIISILKTSSSIPENFQPNKVPPIM